LAPLGLGLEQAGAGDVVGVRVGVDGRDEGQAEVAHHRQVPVHLKGGDQRDGDIRAEKDIKPMRSGQM
jgi:hypothetical protein